jgi:phosphate:Na+ symporter
MSFFDVLTMLGGLALFLYGMDTLGKGLEKASGSKLQKILETLTSNPISAVLLGAGVTAVIQSSSATTVMVVGFVNAGIMKLSQVVGIIMGANIGTTATSWILSLSGIESNNFFIQLLKPSSFSPIIAIIGIILIFASKNDKKKNIGTIMLGFAILMFGMDTMSSALKPLSEVPEFKNLMVKFTNPLLGMLVGTILTAIIQSSSASVGILQALCTTGTVSYGMALPIIMGQNVGTCITAILSAIGANKNAKRAALVHLYFNLIGTTAFIIIFYSLNALVDFAFLNNSVNTAGIAVIHSTFNVAATLVLLPFSKGLEKLAYLSIRDKKEKENEVMSNDFKLLEARFLEQPSFAVEQCKNVTVSMSQMANEALNLSIGLLDHYEKALADRVCMLEDKVDKYEDELGTYLLKISSKSLFVEDSKLLSLLLHCIGDFERISDHAMNVMEVAKEMYDKKLKFSDKASGELAVFTQAVKDIVETTFVAFEKDSSELARTIEPLEELIDDMSEELKRRHVIRLRSQECTIELGFALSDIITNYERIADHCSNLAVYLIQLHEDSIEYHEYIDKLRKGNDKDFNEQFANYKQKYILPDDQVTKG